MLPIEVWYRVGTIWSAKGEVKTAWAVQPTGYLDTHELNLTSRGVRRDSPISVRFLQKLYRDFSDVMEESVTCVKQNEIDFVAICVRSSYNMSVAPCNLLHTKAGSENWDGKGRMFNLISREIIPNKVQRNHCNWDGKLQDFCRGMYNRESQFVGQYENSQAENMDVCWKIKHRGRGVDIETVQPRGSLSDCWSVYSHLERVTI